MQVLDRHLKRKNTDYLGRSTFSEAGFSADEYSAELADLKKESKPPTASRGPASSRYQYYRKSLLSDKETLQSIKKERCRGGEEKDFIY